MPIVNNHWWVARPESAKGVVELRTKVATPFGEPQGVPPHVHEVAPCR